MKPKFVLLAVLMLSVTLALVGVLRDVGTSKAQIPPWPHPVQPFLADASGGFADTTLGLVDIDNYTITNIQRGSRTTLPWIYSGPGFGLEVDKKMTTGLPLGTVYSYVDALCDSAVSVAPPAPGDSDILQQKPCDGSIHPLIWAESTTAVEGTNPEFLKSLVPPYSWLARHSAVIDNICLMGGIANPTTSVLNTVYTNVPFAPNGSAFTATTKLGGDPVVPLSDTCLDSPQSSTSITSLYRAPQLKGDADGPCTGSNCADAAINGVWTDNTVTLTSTGTAIKTVNEVLVNNGPNVGTFVLRWDAEVTDAAVVKAEWAVGVTSEEDPPAALAAASSTPVSNPLTITCLTPGWSLVVIKNILWPVVPGTKDIYADDNVGVFVTKVICGTDATTLVDKEVIWLKATEVSDLDPPTPDFESVKDHLQLANGQTITVTIDELKANHHIATVDGREWLDAEVSDVDGVLGLDLIVAWDKTSVTVDQGGTPAPVGGVVNCPVGNLACITYVVSEPQGQSDVIADLDVTCPLNTVPGLYSVVLKGIDAPVGSGLGEVKASDNAARSVIKVWCGAAARAPDGIEDANGLYARWTAFQSVGISSLQIAGENQKSYKSPPSIVSDVGYVERLVDLQCFWMDIDGCFKDAANTVPCNDDGNGWIDEVESWDDYDLGQLGGIAALDPDGDCATAAAKAQPGHPVDLPAIGGTCAQLPYSEDPNIVIYSMAKDRDCDGLVDGVERAWGSNPLMNDSDSDGAKDFVEMFQQSNPLNPDTDGDGYKDAPVPTYQNANVLYDNCPGSANPTQANNDGLRRLNGTGIAGLYASTPNQDKMGDACDSDDDNDALPDTYEVATALSDPLKIDSDGDCINDGAEVIYKKDPMSAVSKPTWTAAIQQKYYRGCHHNLPLAGTYGASTTWDSEYDGVHNDAEMDIDGDGFLCGNTDADSDNGTGTGAAAPEEIEDKVEAFGWATGIANKDTDGDGCEDWIEMTDVNGNRSANSVDVLLFAARCMAGGPPTDSDPLFDINKSCGACNSVDVLLAAKNSSMLKPATCPGGATGEN